MELGEFAKLIKDHFGVVSEPTDRPYLVRFIGKPFDEDKEACRAISVMAHHRGKTEPLRISPHHILQVLAKFEIPQKDFDQAYDLFVNRVQPIRPSSASSSPPASKTEEKKEAS
jgi:hypothetical protein